MPHFPKPFFKKSRGAWYVQVDGRQFNLGPDQDEAFRRDHDLMREGPSRVERPTKIALIADKFLDWVQQHRAAATFEWDRYRLERFCRRYPKLRTTELKPYHVQQWVDGTPNLSRKSKRNYSLIDQSRFLAWDGQFGKLGGLLSVTTEFSQNHGLPRHAIIGPG